MKHRDEFDLMKLSYEASPLRLYRGTSLVEPADVIGALTGAVVEVFFVIRHYYLRDKKFDTFGADIQRIKILKPGSAVARSGFKWRKAREGPFDIVGVASSSAHAETGGSGRAEKRSKVVESTGLPLVREAWYRRRGKEGNACGRGRFVLLVVHNHITLGCLETKSEIENNLSH